MSVLQLLFRVSIVPLFLPISLAAQVFVPGTGVVDIDGNSYPTVVYTNGKEWMAENLRTTRYSNGDSLTHAITTFDWQNNLGGAWCHYDNDSLNELLYGKLYNVGSVRDERGVCPSGWHVPAKEEWTSLLELLDPDAEPDLFGLQSTVAGGALKDTGLLWWDMPNTGASNSSGFTGLPGGTRTQNGAFLDLGRRGRWWSTDAPAQYSQRFYEISYDHTELRSAANYLIVGYSIRCVKNELSTGIEESADPGGVHAYPNPIANGAQLSITGHNAGSAYRMLTMDGRILRSGSLSDTAAVIGIHGTSAGTYILQVEGSAPLLITVLE